MHFQPSNTLNILIYTSLITPGCLERRANKEYISFAGQRKILMLCKNLASLGHTVDVCSTSYAKTPDRSFRENLFEKIRVIHAPTFGLFGRTSFFKRTIGTAFNVYWLVRHSRKYQLVIFYNYHIEFSVPSLLAKKLLGLKIIMDYEDGLFLDKGYQSSLYRYLEKTVYRESEGFILVNRGLIDRIRQFGQENKPSVVINGFLDSELLQANWDHKDGTDRKIAFSGNFNRSGGFQELLEYVDNLPENFSLNITGRADPQEEAILRDHIQERPNVFFHGYLDTDKFEALLKDMDIFILLNNPDSEFHSTNFPSKLFDYLSRNRFVLSTYNPILEPYYSLSNLIILRKFPGDLRRLDELLKDRSQEPGQLLSLHLGTVESLKRFLEKIL
jgi:hypothetical protein